MKDRLRALLRLVALFVVIGSLIYIGKVWHEARVDDQRHEAGQRAVAAMDLPTPTTSPPTTTTTTIPPTTTEPRITTSTSEAATTTTSSTTTLPPPTTTTLPVPPAELTPDTAFGALTIERLGQVQVALYEGNVEDVDQFALDHGVAHRPGRGIPGSGGNVVIGGHRTSRHAPFEYLETMQPGDQIVIQTIWGGEYTYQVEWVRDMIPTRNEAEAAQFVNDYFGPQGDQETITLYACTPKGKVSHRIVVFGTLVSASAIQT